MLKKDWELHHICLVVRNWNDALDYYQSARLGISVGPQAMYMDYRDGGKADFYFNEDVPPTNGGLGPGKPLEKAQRGRRKDNYTFMDKDCLVGDLLIEIGENKGIPLEGVTHICFNIPDVKTETEKLLGKGCELMMEIVQGGKILENHIDTRKYGNVDISFRPPVLELEKAWLEYYRSYPYLKDWKFHGLGIAVRDLEKTADYYEMLDIIDFESEPELDSRSLNQIKVESYPIESNFQTRTKMGQVGSVAFEFIEPLEGPSIYQESLDSRGEGVADIAFTVSDLEKEAKTMIYRGMPALISGKPKNGPAFACFDTRKNSGNVIIRLIQRE
ncbi:MAG: VOC family protein [Promethearchaeota archaeon]|jgi:catechol 2,3-dioxygenase-like lactoylglutathione lyase family enzyme